MKKYESAVRRDLLFIGLTLDEIFEGGDEVITWTDLHAFLVAAPEGSSVRYAVDEGWSLVAHLLATILDRWNTWIWWHSKDGQAKPPRNEPDRIPRPGVDKRGKSVLAKAGIEFKRMTHLEMLARLKERFKRGN